MAKGAWTPGPWEVDLREPVAVYEPKSPTGHIICLCNADWRSPGENARNARLMAAAPELAGDAAVIERGFTPDPGTWDLDDEQPIVVHMTLGEYRAAVRHLAKARGEV